MRHSIKQLILGLSVLTGLGTMSPALADFSTTQTDWNNFFGSNGYITPYTFNGQPIVDEETSSDTSNGGAAVSPSEVDLASGSAGSNPGTYTTPLYGYYNGGTEYDPNDPDTMNDDYILFRMRLSGDPSFKAGFSSRHWNVLVDVDDDGYKEFWVDVQGDYTAGKFDPDRLNILYDNNNTQEVSDPDAARVNFYSAYNDGSGNNPSSHTNVFPASDLDGGDTSGDYVLDIQVPMTAFVDNLGNQVLFPDSPVGFVFSTSASNSDPLQKDWMMDLDPDGGTFAITDPIYFGDIVQAAGDPDIEFRDASGNEVSFYEIGESVYVFVSDPAINNTTGSSSTVESITITVSDPATGDDEELTLYETGVATGVFSNTGGADSPDTSNSPDAYIPYVTTTLNTASENWTVTYNSGSGTWTVVGSISGTQTNTATAGTQYTSDGGEIVFTLYENATPGNNDEITFTTYAATPLPTTDTGSPADNNGTLKTDGNNPIYATYVGSSTVTDTTYMIDPGAPFIEFTRGTGLPVSEYELTADSGTSDQIYVTVTHADSNLDSGAQDTITVTLTTDSASGDTQTLTLTETGNDTGIFRNTTGLNSQIYDGAVTTGDNLWEDVDSATITAEFDSPLPGVAAVTATATFIVDEAAKVNFTNGAGTLDETQYSNSEVIFVRIEDLNYGACASPTTVTITSTTGDSETVVINETASGSSIYMNKETDLVTTAGSAVVTSAGSTFQTDASVNAGGTFVIASGPDVGTYTIASVDSETQITLTTTLTTSKTGVGFHAYPLIAQTYDGAYTANDGVLEATDEDTISVSYTDCNDGDADSGNDTKTDTGTFNAPPVVINEVLFGACSDDPGMTEYIQLYNASQEAQDITGYSITDEVADASNNAAEFSYTVPSITLQPGDKFYLFLVDNPSTSGFFDGTDTYYYFSDISDAVTTTPSQLLEDIDTTNNEDQVSIYDASSNIVDFTAWGDNDALTTDFLSDDSAAVYASIWSDNTYKDITSPSNITCDQPIKRSSIGVDTDKPGDWEYTTLPQAIFNLIFAVDVEGNAATIMDDGSSTTYVHTIRNNGVTDASYNLTVASTAGWQVELLSTDGTVMAIDTNGDGTWDTVNTTTSTGLISVGSSETYLIRVTDTNSETSDTTRLTATMGNTVSDYAEDVTTIEAGIAAGTLTLTPDYTYNAGAGDQVVLYHTVTNNTGASGNVKFEVNADQTWTVNLYLDTDGDGSFNALNDTTLLSTFTGGSLTASNQYTMLNDASQLIFAVIDVPGGSADGTKAIVDITAFISGEPPSIATATDIITVQDDLNNSLNNVGSGTLRGQELSGGGVRFVNAGDTVTFNGVLENTGTESDTYYLTLAVDASTTIDEDTSNNVAISITHELWIDSTGDGTANLKIAEDTNSDGTWENVNASYQDASGNLFVTLSDASQVAYAIVSAVGAGQDDAYRQSITLTSTAASDGSGNAAVNVSAITIKQKATRADIGEFLVYHHNGQTLVQWETTSEVGTVGFYVERYNTDASSWARLNTTMLPGLLNHRHGGLYRLVDNSVTIGSSYNYRLIEVEASANENTYGPYTITVQASAPADVPTAADAVHGFERIGRALSALEQQRSASRQAALAASAAALAARQGDDIKITTRGAGMTAIAVSDLAIALGLSSTEVQQKLTTYQLSLTQGGQPVAYRASDDHSQLVFYAEAHESVYTDTNTYWLSVGSGQAMRDDRSRARNKATVASNFVASTVSEGSLIPILDQFTNADADYWMWNILYPYNASWVSSSFMVSGCATPDTFKSIADSWKVASCGAYPLASPGVDGSGNATLTVRAHGGFDTSHNLTVKVNGSDIGSISWSGTVAHEASFNLDAALLVDSNTVEVHSAGHSSSTVYMNHLTLSYPRQYTLSTSASVNQFTGPAQGHTAIAFAGLNAESIEVYDITNPKAPVQMIHARFSGNSTSGYQAKVAATAEHIYHAMVPGQYRSPVSVIADKASNLSDTVHAIDYLIITSGESLVTAAQPLADYRASQGLRTMVVDLEDIYDEFNHGIASADAIWSFLAYSWDHWTLAPRYVVLAGDGSIDYRNYLGLGEAIIPTLLTPTPEGLFPSDNLYTDLVGNDWVPEMAIGRIPVVNAAELTSFTAKIKAYEAASGAWTSKMMLAADAPATKATEDSGDFHGDSDALATLIPAAINTEKLHLTGNDIWTARNTFHTAWNEGRAFINFIGHGSISSMGNEWPGLISNSEWFTDLGNAWTPSNINNAERLPIVTGMTCLAGHFGFVNVESLAEGLVTKPSGGAIAVWSPSGLSLNSRAKLLDEGFYNATYTDGELVLGEAILKAQQHFAADGQQRYVLDMFNLIGDPATIMK